MSTQKKFIEELLKKIESQKEGILIPNEFELEVAKIKNFDLETAKELTLINEIIFSEKSTANKSIKFYPIALKKYLNKIN